MERKVAVVGAAMTPFVKPGGTEEYHTLGASAGRMALTDAGIEYADVEQCYVGYVYGESASGQAAVYDIGLTGIPIINVNNNCATGSTALFLARQAIEGGAAQCVLIIGVEQMVPGPLQAQFSDRLNPLDRFYQVMAEVQGIEPGVAPLVQLFGGAGRMHMNKYGTTREAFARIAVKARRHGAQNPLAIFRKEVTLQEVMAAPIVFDPLTRLQCCPPTCGAAAVILCSTEFARKRGLAAPVSILAQSMRTDRNNTFDEWDMRKLAGYAITSDAARDVYETTGIGPESVDVVELDDSFTTSELITYEALGFAPEGEGEKFVLDGENTYGGRVVINPSGGLLSRGHPLGATGVAQCVELTWHLRGQAGARQVAAAKIGLQQEFGLGGASIVTMYGRL